MIPVANNQSEHALMNTIKETLEYMGYVVFRANVGKVRMSDGRFFNTGLPKGFSDLFACKNGRTYFIEVKVKPNKPSPEQLTFLENMRYQGFGADVCYSVEEAIRLVRVTNS